MSIRPKRCLTFGLLWTVLMGPVPAQPGPAPEGTWQESETYGGTVRGTWIFNPATQTFRARWQNGSDAILRLEQYDSDRIVVSRVDSSGPTAGLRVRYEGQRVESGFVGQVTWFWQDQARRGSWSLRPPLETRRP